MQTRIEFAKGVLKHLVSRKRPHGSIQEGQVIPYLIELLPGPKWVDGAGNLHIDRRTAPGHKTLFVAHVDTVHRTGGVNKYREDSLGLHAVDTALGADDAAGVAILAAMVGTVPGYYIFTRGEEHGGIGASYLAEEQYRLLESFDRAIAFDRRGTADVITHQSVGRCCSDEFAEALSDCLNNEGLLYMPCDGGIYTDTAEFVGFIAECTNISTGYYNEHSNKEWLDMLHWEALCRAALEIQWDDLPVSRDPYEPDDEPWGYFTRDQFPNDDELDRHDF